jgi:ER-bound oxygenase mpaB/B'/Rubber oxygenase, catalytic domain
MAKVHQRWLGGEDRYARLRKIEQLDPKSDYREIAVLFYDDFNSVMLLQAVTGFMLTYAAPRMSRILSATGETDHRVAKRFVDTALLARSVLKHGLNSEIGRDAARRVNAMHRQYDIHPEDFIMVGCDEVVMSLRIADQFGWRAVSDAEREALRIYYSHQSRAFGSRLPLPSTLAGMHDFWNQYVDQQLAFESQNLRLARVLLQYVARLMPAWLRPCVRPTLLAQVDPRIVRACGLDVPSKIVKRFSTAAFRLLGRRDPVPDGGPDGLIDLVKTVYPDGWQVNTLGTHVADPE